MMGFGHDTVRRAHTLGGPDALRWGASLGLPLRAGAAPSGPLRRHRCHLRRLVCDVRHIPWVFPVPGVATVRGGEADGRSGGGRPTTNLLAGRRLSRPPKERRPRARRLLRPGGGAGGVASDGQRPAQSPRRAARQPTGKGGARARSEDPSPKRALRRCARTCGRPEREQGPAHDRGSRGHTLGRVGRHGVRSVITVGFTYLFAMRSFKLHAVTTGALTLVVVLLLFTVGVLDHAYDGDVRVGPGAFDLALKQMKQ